MKTIYSNQNGDPGSKHTSSEENHEVIHPYHEENIMDGSEFLDDGIRMKDQPYGQADEEENNIGYE